MLRLHRVVEEMERIMRKNTSLAVLAVFIALVACEGPVGPPGLSGEPGEAGTVGPAGEAGPPGNGVDGGVREHGPSGPGLKLSVSAANINVSNGVATADFTVTDGAGTPLDLNGKYTDGQVFPKFVIAWLDQATDGTAKQYTAYTVQNHKSVDGTKTASMPDSDTGGTVTELGVGQGTYRYTFGTAIQQPDVTKTHTIGVWAYRDFGGSRYVANEAFNFVPNGNPVTTKRDIATTQGCNGCHNPLGEHEDGMQRRDVRLCVLCHAGNVVDVSNGNSLDMPSMIHKIHRGRTLPSVVAGTPYQLTMNGAFENHSDTSFPSDIQNCQVCHTGSQGQDAWQTRPASKACVSCHDDIVFQTPVPVGMKLHGGGTQKDDSKCYQCHIPSGTNLSLVDVHAVATTWASAPIIDLQISGVDSTAPGQTPVLHFSVTKNKQPFDILATPMNSLATVLAGPTTDYSQTQPTSYTIQGNGPVGSLALDGKIGSYTYTFPAPIPLSATGTYAIGMEGFITDPVITTFRYASLNPVIYVAVTDSKPVPRRNVVDRAKCNSCHFQLAAHGGGRRSPEYCVLCHTPNKVGDQRVARFEVPTTVAQSVNFKVLVHKIHRGNKLDQGYVLGGFPAPTTNNPGGTPVDFGKVTFPGNLKACWACHSSTSYLLPLPNDLLPTKTSQVLTCNDNPLVSNLYCTNRSVQSETFLQPISAACTACHDKPSTLAHAQIMTTQNGLESCETCHGSGKQWDVQVVHVLPP